MMQDEYKKKKDPRYNAALRATIKLYLNSLTGKLVENPSLHFSMKIQEEESSHILNGVAVKKSHNSEKINDWVTAGVMVYSYSKRLLFEYIRCLPNDSSDVIHIETDGIYFSTRHLDAFQKKLDNYSGDYPCKMGDDLGNLKIEKTTKEGQVAYFLGKKFYCITINDDYNTKPRDKDDVNIYRVKGLPQKTITADGSDDWLVDVQLYENVFKLKEGDSVSRSYSTMKKCLFTEKTSISSYVKTVKISAHCKYSVYL
jgi:hypothetical protein